MRILLERISLISAKQIGIGLMCLGVLKGLAYAIPVALLLGNSAPSSGLQRLLGAVIFAFYGGGVFLVSGLVLYICSRKKPDYWWPGQSELEQDILAHMTRDERARKPWGMLWSGALAVIGCLVFFYAIASENLWVAGVAALVMAPAFLWLRDLHAGFLCSTPYAKSIGVTPSQLRRSRKCHSGNLPKN